MSRGIGRLAGLASIYLFLVTPRAEDVTGFRSVQRLTNNDVQLRLNSPSAFRIDVSTNLQAWEPLVTGSGQSTQYMDSGAFFRSNRFYSISPVTGTNVFTGDHFATTNGDVVMHPVNHASFLMRWNDMTIYNDPVGANSLYSTFPKADLILVSHSHSDHFSAATIGFVRRTNGIIIVPQAVFSSLSTALRAAAIVLPNGTSTNINGVNIESVAAYNSNHPRGSNNAYVLTIGGKRFFMSGDTGDVPEIRALQNIDVAFLSMNVPFTMNVTTGAAVAREMKPRVLYPYHYRNQDGTFANLNDLKRLIGSADGIEVRTRPWY